MIATRRLGPRWWAAACCLACGATAAGSVLFPLTNTDIWWHLAAGRWMLHEGRFLYADPFSSGALGRPWIDVHWLFQVLAHGVHRLGGVQALALGKALVCGLGAALSCLLVVRHAGPRAWPVGALAVAATVHLAWDLVLARPVVITLLLTSLFVLLLEQHRADGRRRWLVWLLPLQVVWANCQGLFVLGPVILCCYLAGAACEGWLRGRDGAARGWTARAVARLAWPLPLLLLCCMITPYGWRTLELPLTLFLRIDGVGSDLFSLNVSENIPPLVLERGEVPAAGSFKWVAAAAWASFLLVPAGRAVPARALLLLSMCALALMAHRNVLLLHWVAGPLVALNLAHGLERLAFWRGRLARPQAAGVAGLCAAGLAALSLDAVRLRRDDPPLSRVAPFRIPEGGARALRQLDLQGVRIFNSIRYGGYLAWELYPRGRPSWDGRLVIRTPRQFARHLELADRPRAFDRSQRARPFGAALLPAAFPGRYLGLAGHLYRHPDWSLVYTDGTETLFVARALGPPPALDLHDAATVRRIVQRLYARADNPAVREQALVNLGRLLVEAGALQRARDVLGRCAGPAARALEAHVLYLQGDLEQSRCLASRVLERRDDHPDALHLLALVALDRGRHRRALDLVERSLRVNPFARRPRLLLERMRRELSP